MKTSLVRLDYQGFTVAFNEDGWFNATAAAAHYGKRPVDWLVLDSTQEYIGTLCELLRSEKSSLLKVKRGGRGKPDATWFHPKLAVTFARWLDVRFAVWCDIQIEGLLKGQHPHFDWKRQRHEVSASLKVMNFMLVDVRTDQGKSTEEHQEVQK